ncbi:uncharacterized protein N7500_001572 [Penicillium coprophilum]|uniref:uncharacterized protein n=1 Tax=Penicillium coprophilum TaxID=36646 RepID=UPI00238344E8|nr:uncharacterized protein N7500_001572 [Penicillium coprophilum]KAJ5173641.1 hypothetical protein N7500_001572 [Penicillium coprophilum]
MLDLQNLTIISIVMMIMLVLYTLIRSPSNEPPSISSRIPFVGHLIGLIQYGPDISIYSSYNLDSRKIPGSEKHHQHSIFAVNIFSLKVFVTSSPAIMRAAQKRPTVITLEPLLSLIQKRLCQTPRHKLSSLCDQGDGPSLISKIVHDKTHALAGRHLDRMNEIMLQRLLPMIDDMANGETVDLSKWLRQVITLISTDSIYGRLNPFKNPQIENTFWEFERNVVLLLVNIMPRFIAPKAWRARRALCAAFKKYFDLGGHEDGSELLAMRYRSFVRAGLTHGEIAYSEMPLLLGLLANTVPAAFWAHFDIFSRPQLLEDIREELEKNALKIAPDGTHVIDLGLLRDNCPLLLSTYQEVLRKRTTMVTIRFVTQDVVLADKYFLGSGTMLLMPARQLGRDQNAWGASADDFDERRFMNSAITPENQSDKKIYPRRTGGFMTFGVSPAICPGRHFSTSEILALVAIIALRYDMTPVNHLWNEPPRRNSATTSNMCPVEGPFSVTVKKRQKYKEQTWRFKITEGKGQFGLAVG